MLASTFPGGEGGACLQKMRVLALVLTLRAYSAHRKPPSQILATPLPRGSLGKNGKNGTSLWVHVYESIKQAGMLKVASGSGTPNLKSRKSLHILHCAKLFHSIPVQRLVI